MQRKTGVAAKVLRAGRIGAEPYTRARPALGGILEACTVAERHFDMVVIGGGPGGYIGAIRAAQLGYKVAIVERAKLGGVCLNWGCIPSKALLTNAELMEKLAHAEAYGLQIEGKINVQWEKVIGRSRDVAAKLNKGVEFLMKKNKITHIVANAKVLGGRNGSGGKCRVEIAECAVNEELSSAPAIGIANRRRSADSRMCCSGTSTRASRSACGSARSASRGGTSGVQQPAIRLTRPLPSSSQKGAPAHSTGSTPPSA